MTDPTTNVLSTLSNQMADAVERAGVALVLVNGRQRYPASGIVYKPDLVVTADHVLEREEELSIETHDGRTLAAQFIGRDPTTDLALLRVNELKLEPAHAAPSAARVGQFVLAVGRPTSSGPMASIGIVSAIGGPLRARRGALLEQFIRARRGALLEQFIRTDAVPYPGFSGGPLIDTQGNVLGVLTTGLWNAAALAIPTTIAWRIADTLAQHGQVKRGFLGISSQPVQLPEGQRAGQSQEQGLLIVQVHTGSSAAQGGLLVGDILVALDNQPVDDTDDLQALLTGDRVGKAVPVTIIRGGTLQTVSVTVGQRN
ncbi:MAG: S1C family serine protease [Chloroflexales bacterium]|nr:S1C family serine protease [Chloroflexales bacterium]